VQCWEVHFHRGFKWNKNDVVNYERKPMFSERETTLPQTHLAHCPCYDVICMVLRAERKLLAQTGVMILQSDS
jgi:hypothetical protein